jgi:hypothetical protein
VPRELLARDAFVDDEQENQSFVRSFAFSVIKNQTLSEGPDDAIQAEFQDR